MTAAAPDRVEEAEFQRGVDRMVRWGLDGRLAAGVQNQVRAGADAVGAWGAAGALWSARAAQAEADGHLATASTWARQAFYCHRLADFRQHHDGPDKVAAHARSLEAFDLAVRTGAAPAPRRLDIPFEGVALPALFLPPPGAGPMSPAPAAMVLFGADGNKEEHLWATMGHLAARGLGALVVDGPGHGWTRRVLGLPARPDYEHVVSACIDVLAAQPEVDPSRLGLLGSSLGGYYAPRAFAADRRLAVCAVNSAVHDMAEGFWDPCPPIRPQLRYLVAAEDDDTARERYEAFTLEGCLEGLDRPMRVYHGAADRMIPPDQAVRVCDEAGPAAQLIRWPRASHNLGNVGLEAHARMWDWFADALRETDRKI